jgi:hypothetical protein
VAKTNGTITDVFTINSTTGGDTSMTLDVSGDLTLDADGGDIFFKDGGTTFGSATNNSGNLIIKSGTTTAATFSGANVTFAGTVDATTDFTIGTTVITDDSIVMTPSTSDTVTVAAATNGVLNITTVDNAAAAANLNFVVDGAVDVDAAGAINLDSGSGIITFEDSGTEVLRLTEGNSGDVTVKLVTNGKDLVFTDNGDATNMKILDAAAGINVPGEVQTTGIGYTDGDNAMTIADGGKVTFAAGFAVGSDAAGDMLYHNGTSYVRLAKGTADQVLTMNDGATAPNWEAASSGAVSAVANGADNRVATFSSSTALNGEASLTFDGSDLTLAANVGIVFGDAGEKIEGDGTDLFVTANKFNVSGTTTIGSATVGYGSPVLTVSNSGDTVVTCERTSDTGPLIRFTTDGSERGTISTDGSTVAYNTSSDYRLKENQTAISDGLTRVKALKPYRYNFKADSGTTRDGFFAHEVVEAGFPKAVTGAKDGTEYQGLDVSMLVPAIVAALKEIDARVTALE